MTRSLVYTSNAYNHIFPDNSNCEFKSLLPQNSLKDINPAAETLLVGVRRISFTVKTNHSIRHVGITSNIVKNYQIVNNNRVQLLWTFCMSTTKEGGEAQTLEIFNEYPIYCVSSIELLEKASFRIFDTASNEDLNHIVDKSVPTVLEICFKTMPTTEDVHFNLFINSDHQASTQVFPSNNNMDFSILLPERLQLESGWGLVLRDLSMTSKFPNFREEEHFTVQTIKFPLKWKFDDKGEKTNYVQDKDGAPPVTQGPHSIQSGDYQSLDELLKEVNKVMQSKCDIPYKMFSNGDQGNRVKIRRQGSMDLSEGHILMLSHRLAVALGFQTSLNSENHPTYIDLAGEDEFNADYPANINKFFYPRQIMVHCDVLSTSIVGNGRVKLLHLINTKEADRKGEMINLNMINRIFKDLEVFSFQKIRFWITDLDGVKLTSLSKIPTSLCITFMKLT